MNNLLNEYFRFNFEMNIELNYLLARFNVKMNNQNVSATPTPQPPPKTPKISQISALVFVMKHSCIMSIFYTDKNLS